MDEYKTDVKKNKQINKTIEPENIIHEGEYCSTTWLYLNLKIMCKFQAQVWGLSDRPETWLEHFNISKLSSYC